MFRHYHHYQSCWGTPVVHSIYFTSLMWTFY